MASHLDLEEQEQLDQIKHFWNKWGTPITGVLVVVLGGFAAWNGWQYWENRQAVQASALADAVEVAATAHDTARLDQAFGDLKAKYAGTVQAAQSALLVAQKHVDGGKLDEAKAALSWAAEKGADEGYQSLARLRLAAVLMEQKQFDEATKLLSGSFPAEFAGMAADRLGDVLQQQDKKAEAVAAYQKAHAALVAEPDYRRLVESKLNALGVAVPAAAVAK